MLVKMNKIIVTIISIVVVFFAVFVGVEVYNRQEKNQNTNQVKNTTEISEVIIDECTEEWEEMSATNELDIQANTQEQIKLSPNCSFTFKTHYQECGHVSNQYTNIPQELINKTEAELQQKYPEWKIETFESNQVVLSKNQAGECGEHYVLKDVDGKIVVYVINDKGEEEVYQKTEIAIDYLTDTDKITIKNGLKVYGKENLNQVIEDFE